MSKLSSELRLTLTCHMWSRVVNSEFAVARRDRYLKVFFFDRYHLRETHLSGIEMIWKAGVIEQKRQNRKKQKRKRKEV